MATCVISIDGKQYDVSQWKDIHPGGNLILEQYHEKDATDIFYAMHSKQAHEKVSRMKSTGPSTLGAPSPKILAFRQLRKELHEKGLFVSSKLWYLQKAASTLGLFALGFLALSYGNWMLGAVLVGFGYQQAGWFGHDVCHHNIFENRKVNNFFAYFFGNVVSGFSANWWKDRHNTHHAITNVLDADPDVDNLPLFVWSEEDIHRIPPQSLAEYIVPYQQYYFIPFTFTLKVIWCLQSIFFVKNTQYQNQSYLKSLNFEKATLALHYLLVFGFMMMTPSWSAALSFLLISEGIGGSLIALIVFMNHYACEQLTFEDGKQANFLELQLLTTRNINQGPIMDWVAGGLNYQIEHHLFPTIPRHNLSKLKPIVEDFCKKHELPYESLSFWACLMAVENKLSGVAQTYSKIAEKTQ